MLRFFILLVCWSLASATVFDKKPLLKNTVGSRIVNGELAELGQFPWQASLRLLIGGTFYFCGGTVIDKDWILTSGYCLDQVESVIVHTGIVNTNDVENDKKRESEEIFLHESFNPDDLENSIGLIKLKSSLDLDDYTNVIGLVNETVGAGEDVVVSGWGSVSNNDGQLSQELRYASLKTTSQEDCEFFYGPNSIFPENMCAVHTSDLEQGPCAGDTGGPLVAYLDSVPMLVGITDFISAAGCEAGHPAGFTRVSSYRDWIREKTGL